MSEPLAGAVPPSHPPDETELTARFWHRIRLFATRQLSDAAAAEDVAQETLRRVVESLRAGRVADLAALPGFVFQTARHICLQHHRSAGREARALARLEREPRASAASDPLTGLVSEERRQAVREAIAKLPEEERELLGALYHRQEDSAAIAARLGITAGALRVRKHRALKRLGELLGRPDL